MLPIGLDAAPSYTSDLALTSGVSRLTGKNGRYDRLSASTRLRFMIRKRVRCAYTGSDGNYINGLVVRSVDVVDPNGEPIEGI